METNHAGAPGRTFNGLPPRHIDVFQYVADVLDTRDSLSKAHLPDLTSRVLSGRASISQLALDRSAWERVEALEQYPSIVGVLQRDDHVTLELKASSGTHHAVQVDPFGQIKPVDLASARKEFEAHAERGIKEQSTGIRLYSVSANPDGSPSIFVAGMAGPGVITEAEYDRLLAGTALLPDHWLSQTLQESRDPLVLYSNAYMQSGGGAAQQEADKFTSALQRSYPQTAIYRDPLSTQTAQRAKRMNEFHIAGPGDVSAIVTDTSVRPRPTDFRVLQNARETLKAAHVNGLWRKLVGVEPTGDAIAARWF